MTTEIVGREEELASVHAFIGAVEGGAAALVARGRGGNRQVHALARRRRACALARHARARVTTGRSRARSCSRGARRPVRGRRRRVLPALAAPRRRALEVALLLDEASDEGRRSPFARRRGAQPPRASQRTRHGSRSQSTTCSGSTRRPPSALAFALRRIDSNRVLLLLARRLGDEAQTPGIEQALARRSRPASAGRTAQRRRSPPIPARPARHVLRAPDAASHPRAVGRQSVLRARAGPRPRRRRRPAAAAAGSRDARGARPREDRRAPCSHPSGARARLGARHAFGVSARAGGRRGRGPRAGGCRARHRARERRDSLHAPAALIGSLPGARRRAAQRSRTSRAESSTTRCSAPVISRSRRTRPTPASRGCSTTPRGWRPTAARRLSRPSSPSRRSA